MSSALLIERQGAIATWTLNDPATRNALSDAVVDGLLQACARAAQDATLRTVVLTGAGERAFCAGADLKPDSSFLQFDYSETHSDYANLLRRANHFDIPLIARVNGHVMAGGVGLLSMCDMAIAADDVRIGLPEVKIGAFPMQVASVLQQALPGPILRLLRR